MSVTKGLKKTIAKSKDDDPKRSASLDASAYTEISPFSSFEKMAKKKGKMFTDGFKRMKDQGPAMSETPNLYPAPNAAWNISGSDKVAAAAGGMGPIGVPQTSARGANPTLKNMSGPKRVTHNINPMGAPEGLKGLSGHSNTTPFKNAFGNFGHKTRMGIKSITRAKRGL